MVYLWRHPTGNILFENYQHFYLFFDHQSQLYKRQYERDKAKSQSKEELPRSDEAYKGQYEADKAKSESKEEPPTSDEIKVKVNNVDEMIKIWDVLYPKN